MHTRPLEDAIGRRLVFVIGKGGVGKTAVSQAIALHLSKTHKRTLWIEFENPAKRPGELKQMGGSLWHLNCDPAIAFEEYVGLQIGAPALTRIFLQNKLMRYFSKAAPGIHDLVMIGKVWHERERYDHVVVDMPSTGYGVALFHSTANFARLFAGGPVHRDAEAMLLDFRDPAESGLVIVALPEEMPLVEAVELGHQLEEILPTNPPAFVVNRLFPSPADVDRTDRSDRWKNPVPTSVQDYARKRSVLEGENLGIWRDQKMSFKSLSLIAPEGTNHWSHLVESLAKELDEIHVAHR